jgi:hypothetical protein
LFTRFGRVFRRGQIRVSAGAAFCRQTQYPRPQRREHSTAGRQHLGVEFVQVTDQCVVGLHVLLGVLAVAHPDAKQKPAWVGGFDARKGFGDRRCRRGPDIDDPGGQLQRGGLRQGWVDPGQFRVR